MAAKCWAALFAIRDWAGSLADGKDKAKPEKKASWTELIQLLAENQRTKNALAAWKPRELNELGHLPSNGPAISLPENTPERVVTEFLECWSNRQYGPMAEALVDYLNKPKGRKAGNAKRDFGHCVPNSFRIVAVADEAPAISQVEVEVNLGQAPAIETIYLNLRLMYNNPANDALISRSEAGSWRIFQNGFADVIHRR